MSKGRLFILGLLGSCCLSACQSMISKPSVQPDSRIEHQPAEVGKDAPDFTLEGINGKAYRLSDFRGKKIYIKFWASWCSICLSSLGETEQLAQDQGNDYLVLTLVAPDQNGEMSLTEFKKWYSGLGYEDLPVLFDREGQVLENYSVRAYPSSAFIDSNGKLVTVQIGYMDANQVRESLETID